MFESHFNVFIVVAIFGLIVTIHSEGEKPLHLMGFLPMSGNAWSGGAACLPAIEMGVRHVNSRKGLLDGYHLNFIWKNSQCDAGLATNQMYEMLYGGPTKIMMIGPGCSPESEATAQAAYHWNITQLSWASSSPTLSDKKRFPKFFRILAPDSKYNVARIAMLMEYNWKKVSTINEALDFHSAVIDGFVKSVKNLGVDILSQEIFDDDPLTRMENLKKRDARIIVAQSYPDKARLILCAAYKVGLYGPKIVWMFPGWYHEHWWRDDTSSHSCTLHQMDLAAEGHILTGFFYRNPIEEKGIANITSAEFDAALVLEPNYSPDHAQYNFISANCYDVIWAAALALNCTETVLKQEGHANPELDSFDYSDGDIGDVITSCLSNISFLGTTGIVVFGVDGDPIKTVKVGRVEGGNTKFVGIYNPITDVIDWINGGITWAGSQAPRDSTVVEVRTLYLPLILYVPMACLAGLGIILSVSLLVFNILYRNNRVVKLSSPNINNALLLGCMIMYSTVLMQTYKQELTAAMCKLRTFTGTLGFSLAFGALFSKTWRVYRIFSNKKLLKMRIRDSQLFIFVAVYLAILTLILIIWESIDPQRTKITHLPNEIQSDKSDFEIHYIHHMCVSSYFAYFSWTLYVIEGALLCFGAFLAWETRKVQIEALNDSRQIGMCLYNVVVLSALGLTLSFLLDDKPRLIYGLLSGFVIIGTTATILIVFVPKVLSVYRGNGKVDPNLPTLSHRSVDGCSMSQAHTYVSHFGTSAFVPRGGTSFGDRVNLSKPAISHEEK